MVNYPQSVLNDFCWLSRALLYFDSHVLVMLSAMFSQLAVSDLVNIFHISQLELWHHHHTLSNSYLVCQLLETVMGATISQQICLMFQLFHITFLWYSTYYLYSDIVQDGQKYITYVVFINIPFKGLGSVIFLINQNWQ